jgi:arabinofuranosyltransferase
MISNTGKETQNPKPSFLETNSRINWIFESWAVTWSLLAIGALLLILFWGFILVTFEAAPAEDALILFRYSRNLRDGQGIVWNIGGLPAEGATDFLWMALLALSSFFLSENIIITALGLGLVFTVSIISLIYLVYRRMQIPPLIFSIVSLLVLATPILIHVSNGYAVPMYTFSLSLVTIFSYFILAHSENPSNSLLAIWALSMLLAGLTRPEGNFFNAIVILIILAFKYRMMREAGTRKAISSLLLLYFLPAFIFWLWRFSYFGLPFPLPFYIKGSTELGNVFNLLTRDSSIHVILSQIPLAIILFWQRDRSNRALRLLYSAIIIFFILYLVGFSQSQNDTFRFQYHTFILALILAGMQIGLFYKNHQMKMTYISIGLITLATMLMTVTAKPLPARAHDLTSTGNELSQWSEYGYTMAVTQAGQLPYFSNWVTLDTLGLNDPRVAIEGLNLDIWDSYNPDLVLLKSTIRGSISIETICDINVNQVVCEMMRNSATYIPVAAISKVRRDGFRPLDNFHIYFLRQDTPNFDEISQALTTLSDEVYLPIPEDVVAFFNISD